MNEGFFKSSELNGYVRRQPLPPPLTIAPPQYKPKTKSKPIAGTNIAQLAMNIECYVNYFLITFMDLEDDKFVRFEKTEYNKLMIDEIKSLLKKYEIVTFNGNSYDIPILRLALTDTTNSELKAGTDLLIKSEMPYWKFEKKYDLPNIKIKHIDLIEIPRGQQSLKIYGGRLHCKLMQDQPIDVEAELTDAQMDEISDHCDNNLKITKLLYLELLEEIEIRREMTNKYKIDLMSKSDAQIAEAVIPVEIEKIIGRKLEKREICSSSFYYTAPDYIQFSRPKLQEALHIITNSKITIQSNGRPIEPEEFKKLKNIKVGFSTFRMGIGGIHSMEKSIYHITNDEHSIHDVDVKSFYPMIILNCSLYPKQLTKTFLPVFERIVIERLEAKEAGDKKKAGSFKIIINGAYGKFGSPYSILYAPELMLQVTLTGQLSLLMLTEMLEDKGISVVSGNTDGIAIKCPKGKEIAMERTIKRWEHLTKFEMEQTNYLGLYSRDINNYLAIKEDGSTKLIGCFGPPDIHKKNPENEICTIAMINYLKYGTPIKDTITNCNDITKFVTIRRVNGGANKDGDYVGKAIRWYHAKDEKTPIVYIENGKQVAGTEGAKPLMDISVGFPDDIDYNWYINACYGLFGK